jgi:hypothetical protein
MQRRLDSDESGRFCVCGDEVEMERELRGFPKGRRGEGKGGRGRVKGHGGCPTALIL